MEATHNAEIPANNIVTALFTGSGAANYDTYMGPLLFTPYGKDLAGRLKLPAEAQVLELAAGTGRVTAELLAVLPPGAKLTATDISADMLAVAQGRLQDGRITWAVADMAALPYADGHFDAIACGFGLMFAPDKVAALKEMRRVLKTGGRLLLSTWGSIEENPMWQIGFCTLGAFFGDMPFPAGSGPFGLTDEAVVLDMLRQAGFTDARAEQVRKTSVIGNAGSAANAFLMTAPQMAKDPSLFPQVQEKMEAALAAALGSAPLHAPLLALMFEAVK